MPIFEINAATGEIAVDKEYSQFIRELNELKPAPDLIQQQNQYPLLHTAVASNSLNGCLAVIDDYRFRYNRANSNQDFTFPQAINFKENINGYTALHLACLQGKLDFVKLLMEKGKAADNKVDKLFNLPLHYAVLNGHKEIVRYLLSGRLLNDLFNILLFNGDYDNLNNNDERDEAAINTENGGGDTPLILALNLKVHDEQSANSRDEIIDAILLRYNDIQIENDKDLGKLRHDSYLLMAIRNKVNFSILEKLIKRKFADINKKNGEGQSALHLAVSDGDMALLQFLLENHADTALKNDQGMTALHLALTQQNVRADIVEMLLDYASANGNLDVGDNDNNRAIHIAAKHCDPAITTLIIDYGASINLTNNQGETAFVIAARSFMTMPEIDCDDDFQNMTEEQKIIFNKANNQYYNSFNLQYYTNMNYGNNKEVADQLDLFLNPKKKLSTGLAEAENQENSDHNNAQPITPKKIPDLILPIEGISPPSSPASSARPLNQSTHRKIVRYNQQKTIGFFERLNNYRIHLWRNFKSTKVGRFVRRHPYISAGIFTLCLTGFVALCVFAPPVAAHIPILLGVSNALVGMKILSASASILKPIAETVAMNLPAAALALYVVSDFGIRSAYKKIKNYFWPPKFKYVVEVSGADISSNVSADNNAAQSVKSVSKEVINQEFKKQQKSSTKFSFVDDCCSLFNCCGGRKVKVLTDQHRVESMKGKEVDRESIEATSSSVRIDPPSSSAQLTA